MLKTGIQTLERNDIHYIVKDSKRVQYASLIGDLLAGRYEKIMRNNVFPRLLNADYAAHNDILTKAYSNLHKQRILELGTGSGGIARILSNDNQYTGVDISRRLLTIAVSSFENAGFSKASMYLCSADDLPFAKNTFDVCICNLSLNFFPNLGCVLSLLHNVIKPNGMFLCSVPVVERMPKGRRVRGAQFTLASLDQRMHSHGFDFTVLPEKNGAIVYFQSTNTKGSTQ